MQSARRAAKRARPRKEDQGTSSDSSEEDVDKAIIKVEDNEETARGTPWEDCRALPVIA